MQKIKDTKIFVDEVETQLREKPLWGSQTQDIHRKMKLTSKNKVCA
jgi:hypothetical protein